MNPLAQSVLGLEQEGGRIEDEECRYSTAVADILLETRVAVTVG